MLVCLEPSLVVQNDSFFIFVAQNSLFEDLGRKADGPAQKFPLFNEVFGHGLCDVIVL